jgi:hypothetical protein
MSDCSHSPNGNRRTNAATCWSSLLGAITITGLSLVVAGVYFRFNEVAYPVPIYLLCSGAACALVGGIPWAHTRGHRRLKTAFLGLVGFISGGTAGLLLGDALGPKTEDGLGLGVFMIIAGFWVGAIMVGGLAMYWGVRIHHRL